RNAIGTPATGLTVFTTDAGIAGLLQFWDGDSWESVGTGSSASSALDNITAATTTNTIASADNAQVWNWALTTADKDAFTFGETTASTATGSASILKAETLASSTATPLMVTNLGNGLSFRVNDETGDADTTPFVVDAAGNVGIGTAAPGNALEVVGTAQADGLQLDGVTGAAAPTVTLVDALNDLSDVTITSATSGECLTYNGAAWVDGPCDILWTAGAGDAIYYNTGAAPQVGIGTDTPNASAILDLSSTAKGLLPPRMTGGERDLIGSPATGLLVYNTTTNTVDFYNGSGWTSFSTSASSASLLTDGTDTTVNVDTAGDGSANTTVFTNGGTQRMVLSATGQLGIGDFSSDTIESTLHIVSGDIRLDGGAANQAGCLRYDDATDKMQYSHDCTTFQDLGTGSGGLWSDSGSGYIEYSASLGGVKVASISGLGAPTFPAVTTGGSGSGTGLTADSVLESHLKAVDTANDEECLTYESTTGDFEWQTCGSGGGTPGGSATQVQYNDGSGFAGDADFTWDATGNTLSVTGSISLTNRINIGGTVGLSAPTYPASSGGSGGGKWSDGATSGEIYYNSGNVGIGNTDPSVALDVTGDIEYTGTLTDVSDRRLKTDIRRLDTDDMLERLAQVDAYTFRMKDDEKGRIEYGVMAQELEPLFPELVHTAADELGTKSVNYIGLIAPMIEATKSLKAENDALRAELEALREERAQTASAVEDLAKQVELLNRAALGGTGRASMPVWMVLLLFAAAAGGGWAVFARRRAA
ncbi:MAG: hypothetical protein EOM26_13035, partial [Alphaproteobacteria bacterium]|nr:hypothetical protein [Alphaproteobacteria bacterium]